MNIVSSALGHYEATGNTDNADCIIGHSFGTETGKNSVNRALANFILDNQDNQPIVADRMLADAFPKGALQIDEVIEGQISDGVGRGLGTWGTLVHASEFMKKNYLEHPLMVAQAFHIGRIAMQANKLNINPIIPIGLPTQFDRESEQTWTRSRGLWVPREILGSFVLRAQQKL